MFHSLPGLALLHVFWAARYPDGKRYRNHYEYVELASPTDHAATWTKANWRFFESEDLTIPDRRGFWGGPLGKPGRA